MIGQDFVVATLQKSIAAGKIAHAYLFSGPRGCGKTSSARILAKALNCQEGPSATPCGKCPACVEIARGSSLDVIEIDGASNTSVNDVRQIKDEVQFPPNSCRYKVYIIDEVHMLSTSAFNALLKTIEEPPPYVVFIFATTEIHKVPATIKSRCQQFNFRLVPVELLKDVLAQAAAESSIHADDEALFWIAREATGSVRDAYTLFDQVAAFSDGHITFEKIRDKLGLVGVDRINPVVEACASRDSLAALTALDDILQSGVSVEQFTVDLADYFRSLLLIRSGITKESLLGQSPERFSARVLELWSPVQIERALSSVLQLFRDIRYSIDPRYELELTVSRLAWISDYVSPAEMRQAIAQAQSLLVKGSGTRRDSGPFPDAAKAAESRAPISQGISASHVSPDTPTTASTPVPVTATATAAPIVNSVSSDTPPASEDPDDPDARIQDPFAAFKKRLNGDRFGSASAVPSVPAMRAAADAEAPQAVNEAGPAAVPYPAAETHSVQEPRLERDHEPVPVTAAPRASAEPPREAPPPAEGAVPASAPAGAQRDAPAIPFSEFPEALVAALQSTKNMVAAGIAQGFDWSDAGSVVRFSVDKPFVHNLLEQERRVIADAASRILGRPCGIEIRMDESRAAAATEASQAIPAEVETVRMMFRGTIV
jgi:DNA polymerase-3 subunit gamma/tau